MLFKKVFILTVACGLFAGFSFATPRECGSSFKGQLIQVEESKGSISKLIRSNMQHFWSYMAKAVFPPSFQILLRHQGVTAGDPHFGNFSILPVVLESGRRVLRFLNIDFDDAGRAPFVLDFVRLVTAIKAIEMDLKKDEAFAKLPVLVEAYVNGLNGRTAPVPDRIQEGLEGGIQEYDAEMAQYIERRTQDHRGSKRFNNLENDLEAIGNNSTVNRQSVAPLFPGKTVLDVKRVVKSRGGSAELDRFWVLVQNEQSELQIVEFKQWQETSLTLFQDQLSTDRWLRSLYPTFWPGVDPESYKLVQVRGIKFWQREKRKSLVDVPYEIQRASDLRFLEQLAIYVANELGRIHGRQDSSGDLKAALNTAAEQTEFKDNVKEIYKAYLDVAIQAMED